MYDPRLGQWLSEDPIGFGALDENLHRAMGNSPTIAVDPEGTTVRHITHDNPENDRQRLQLADAKRAFDSLLDAMSLFDNFPGVLARAALSPDFEVAVIWVSDLRADDPLSRAAALARRHGVRGPLLVLDYTSGNFLGRGTDSRRAGFEGEGGRVDDLAVMMIVMAHELGHALAGLTDPGSANPGGGVVPLCEDPLRTYFRLPHRPYYGRFELPLRPPTVNVEEQTRAEEFRRRYRLSE